MASQQDYDRQIRRLTLVPGTADAPLYITPQSAAPTNTNAGDVYWDSDDKCPRQYSGSAWELPGSRRVVKAGAATLTAADSGALCVFNNATGFTYTLPAAEAGLWFDFIVTTTVTSGVARVACATGDFLLGTIIQVIDTTFAPTARDADGSTHLAWEGNGGTTGGIKGDWFRVQAVSGTQWYVYGYNTATGTEATPFKTS